MIKIALFTLFVMYTLPQSRGHTGAAGQDCSGSANNVQCVATADSISASGQVQCDDLACCRCESITCSNCEKLDINGDKGAFGVPSITVTGNTDVGAEIIGNGESSLEGAVFTSATNIKTIKFDGYKSFANGMLSAVCMASEPCDVHCGGAVSCSNAVIDVSNVEKVKCNDRACVNATITVTNPVNEFTLECNEGSSGCMGANIAVIVTECVDIKWIRCGSESGCRGATIKVVNAVSGTGSGSGSCVVDIAHIDCGGSYSCANSSFIFEGGVNVNERSCGDNGCVGATGLEQEVVSHHNIMVGLDFSALENIWAIVIVCVLFYVTLFWCYYHKKSTIAKAKEQTFGDSLP